MRSFIVLGTYFIRVLALIVDGWKDTVCKGIVKIYETSVSFENAVNLRRALRAQLIN